MALVISEYLKAGVLPNLQQLNFEHIKVKQLFWTIETILGVSTKNQHHIVNLCDILEISINVIMTQSQYVNKRTPVKTERTHMKLKNRKRFINARNQRAIKDIK